MNSYLYNRPEEKQATQKAKRNRLKGKVIAVVGAGLIMGHLLTDGCRHRLDMKRIAYELKTREMEMCYSLYDDIIRKIDNSKKTDNHSR
ncbi:MAG: hypothetical protein ACP5KJ_02190 [Candidatus Micrarchaeia archaeon]